MAKILYLLNMTNSGLKAGASEKPLFIRTLVLNEKFYELTRLNKKDLRGERKSF